jgi:hypothetical protein
MTLERLNGLLIRAGIDPLTGETRLKPDMSLADLERIIAEDKAKNWPRIEAAKREKEGGRK